MAGPFYYQNPKYKICEHFSLTQVNRLIVFDNQTMKLKINNELVPFHSSDDVLVKE